MMGISVASASRLGAFLARYPQISNLNLSRCPDLFTEVGMKRLLGGLGAAELPRLKSLDLGACDIQVESATHLGSFLARCSNLQTLALNDNAALFTHEGLEALSQGLGLGGPLALSKLQIAGCNIQPTASLKLGNILAQCSNLEQLSLSMSPKLLTANGLAGLEEGLCGAKLPALQQVALYNCLVEKAESKEHIRELFGAPTTCSMLA
jgi:hypothetical protein